MKLFELPLLADENIHPQVIPGLTARRRDICSVFDSMTYSRANSSERNALTWGCACRQNLCLQSFVATRGDISEWVWRARTRRRCRRGAENGLESKLLKR